MAKSLTLQNQMVEENKNIFYLSSKLEVQL